MAEYRVTIHRFGWETVSVEADSEEQAESYALAGRGDYVDSEAVECYVDEVVLQNEEPSLVGPNDVPLPLEFED